MDDPGTGAIREFWSDHPVGADHVTAADWQEFFRAYDRHKQRYEGHIREEIGALPLAGRRVLEVGTGQGSEAQALVEGGAGYTGVDLTLESVGRVRRRFECFGFPRPRLAVGAAEALPFPDGSFDLAFSHGVLHHSPRIVSAVAEIHRVLRPGGQAVVMLYHRHSLNYQLSIRVLRRAGVLLLAFPGVARAAAAATGEPLARVAAHRENLRREGLGYLRMERFIHASTDGPYNIHSSVWSETEARRLFGAFGEVCFRKHFLNERHFPVLRSLLPRRARQALAARWGWHLWIFATK